MTASPSSSSGWFSRRTLLIGMLVGAVASLSAVGGVAAYLYFSVVPTLPALDAITDYRPKIPLRIYTADHVLIGEFGEEHRRFVSIKDMPPMMVKALLAIEDSRFYEHGGIDWIRAMGAARSNLRGGLRQGASTITMQVARNFFLSRDRVYSRKIAEVLLAYKIEAALSKEQILELYMNQIYLGQRSYGFGAAAETYFGKSLKDLSVAEMAMLAGLPQNPARHNPTVNPKRAKQRQEIVLRRLRELAYISAAEYKKAVDEPMRVNHRGQEFDVHAEYVAELARQAVYAQYKDEAYTKGISVTTTIRKAEQTAAYDSVRRNVIAYDQRHGYRGPEAYVELPAEGDARDDAIDEALQKRPASDGLIPAMVTAVTDKLVRVETSSGETVDISGDGLKFAAAALSPKAKASYQLRPGAVIRVAQDDKQKWSITQVPQVAAAFLAIDATSGAYHALVGGFDFNLQKFNHVTQAWRQPGSSIKPFIYSAALEKGYSPATLILDAPLNIQGPETNNKLWSPQNDDGVFDGQVTMRFALAHSKNVPSIRILRALTVPYAHDYLGKFGFDPARHPRNLTMALGTGLVTPLQMAGAYAVFANGGFQVQPYLIARITDGSGAVLAEVKPVTELPESARVLDGRNAFVVDSMLREVTRTGTGAASTVKLGRTDLAGKTGTTNDSMDGWFSGYSGGIVGVAWMGYDEPRSLGGREFGATVSLPIWIDYMRSALPKAQQAERVPPEGLTFVAGDWMYNEFMEMGAIRTLDIAVPEAPPAEPGDGPGAVPGAAPGTVPATATAPAVPGAPGVPAAPPAPAAPVVPPVPAPARPLPEVN